MSDHSQLDATIAAMGLEYSAEFVPQSRSRNANEKRPSLNWRVTIKKGRVTLTTDYTQGIGHLPKNNQTLGEYEQRWYESNAAETGKMGRVTSGGRSLLNPKPIPAPLLRDVLYCLVTDSDVLDFATFEDWADAYYYDTDSRSAEKTYRACLDTALRLRALIGDDGLRKLQEAFQDY